MVRFNKKNIPQKTSLLSQVTRNLNISLSTYIYIYVHICVLIFSYSLYSLFDLFFPLYLFQNAWQLMMH